MYLTLTTAVSPLISFVPKARSLELHPDGIFTTDKQGRKMVISKSGSTVERTATAMVHAQFNIQLSKEDNLRVLTMRIPVDFGVFVNGIEDNYLMTTLTLSVRTLSSKYKLGGSYWIVLEICIGDLCPYCSF
jgi:hypothetical protein